MNPTVTFYGAAGGVTGSKHLVEVDGKRVLLDCGTFQGLSDVRERNRGFPFAPDSIDAVVISHAHQDHIGMLPLLVKRGFTGPIYATPATKDIAAHMLEDSAGIEMQDAEYRARHHVGAPGDREPLFTSDDIPPVIEQFVDVPYVREKKDWQAVVSGVKLKFYDAGHILGSAVSVLNVGDKTIAYTGDLGPQGVPLLRDPEVPEEAISTLLMESTYGSRQHEPLEYALDRLAETINKIYERGGKMIVPAFSLGRTQVFVYLVHKLTDEGKVPRFPIYVDSPLATDITSIYKKHTSYYDEETVADFGKGHPPLAFRNLTYTQSVQESKELNVAKGSFMIISASGMMTAGRVVHHLRHSISEARNAVFVTGYQAEGTIGRRLIEGARKINLYGDQFTVKAEMLKFNEFSAHADQNQLVSYAEKIEGIKQIALVHGEPSQSDDLAARLNREHEDWHTVQPNEGDTMSLE